MLRRPMDAHKGQDYNKLICVGAGPTDAHKGLTLLYTAYGVLRTQEGHIVGLAPCGRPSVL